MDLEYKKEFLEYYLWNVKWFLGVNPFILALCQIVGVTQINDKEI